MPDVSTPVPTLMTTRLACDKGSKFLIVSSYNVEVCACDKLLRPLMAAKFQVIKLYLFKVSFFFT